jgi:hypothetical protein
MFPEVEDKTGCGKRPELDRFAKFIGANKLVIEPYDDQHEQMKITIKNREFVLRAITCKDVGFFEFRDKDD